MVFFTNKKAELLQQFTPNPVPEIYIVSETITILNNLDKIIQCITQH